MIENLWVLIPLFIIIGLIAGFITGVMGGSGVIVVVPMLTLLGFTVYGAIGTSLFVDIIASIVCAYTYYQNKNVDVKDGLWMALMAVVGAQIGTLLATSTPAFGMSWGFGLYLVIVGALLYKTGLQNITEKLTKFEGLKKFQGDKNTPEGRRKMTIISMILGFIIGLVSGFFGAGGGIMFLIVLIFILGYEMKIAIGTSTLIMAITATSGAIGYFMQGYLDIFAALIIGLATLISGRFGAKAANQWDEEKLGKIIAIILIGLGLLMISSIFIS